MLKGHVFKQQIFGNQIFALFIDTFLDGNNGISNKYKNKMALSYSGSTITVQSGAVCIRGRFLEEDSSTDISAGIDTAYCKLVIEVDLDKQNSESDFVQGSYKVVKSTSAYPELTQTDIVQNNSGIYQYELARFKTNANGITEFEDRRTFLDFESIYTKIENELQSVLSQNQTEYETMLNTIREKLVSIDDESETILNQNKTEYETMLNALREELASVEDGSAYVLKTDDVMYKDNIAVITGTMELEANTEENLAQNYEKQTILNIDFPDGFNKDNCVCLAFGMKRFEEKNYNYGVGESITNRNITGAYIRYVVLGSSTDENKICLQVWQPATGVITAYYKIVLMKV